MAKVLGPNDGRLRSLGPFGIRFLIDASESGGGFSLVEHPMEPRCLAAPLHRHSREDEYSFVLEGRIGALLGGETVYGEVGDLIFKPRNQWHTFWNAGDEPARILEIISPGGFEGCFAEITDPAAGPPTPESMAAVTARYGIDIDWESIGLLVQQYGLRFGPAPA
jgi:quercetin dioxygenase-like cupin family protein